MKKKLPKLYESLICLMQEEIEACVNLCDCLEKERDVLKGAPVDEIYENNARKENCIVQSGKLADIRTQVMKNMGAILGIPRKKLNISALMDHADEGVAKDLARCQSVLRSLASDIDRLNQRNRMLLDAALFHVRKSVDFLGQLIYPGSTYMNTGRMKGNNLNGRILSREG